jgi:hypothetical protein
MPAGWVVADALDNQMPAAEMEAGMRLKLGGKAEF